MRNKDIKMLEEAYGKIMESFDEVDIDNFDEPVYDNGEIIKDDDGNEIGEVYPMDSSREGKWGYLHYPSDHLASDMGDDGIDSKEEAIQSLKDAHVQYWEIEGPSETTDDEDNLKDKIYEEIITAIKEAQHHYRLGGGQEFISRDAISRGILKVFNKSEEDFHRDILD